jgi:hypothetical protein
MNGLGIKLLLSLLIVILFLTACSTILARVVEAFKNLINALPSQ